MNVYNQLFIHNKTQQKWSGIISEEYGIKDQNKLQWMSQYAQNHEIYEGVQTPGNVSGGIYGTPLNTMGMGNPQMPSNAGLPGGKFGSQEVGSGDIPMSTLTMALEVAAVTMNLFLLFLQTVLGQCFHILTILMLVENMTVLEI